MSSPDVEQLTPEVSFEVVDRCAVITIDRPPARNAVNAGVAQGIEAGLDRLEEDDELWTGVITGGPPVFCAGADLKEVSSGTSKGQHTPRGGFAGIVRRERTKPLIAAVEGPALAGGLEIVLACDLVVAAEGATFGLPEVKRALVAGAGGLFRLGRRLPLNLALEHVLTGDPIPAPVARQHGLVNAVTEDGGARAAAVALAARISANAPVAVRASRRVVLADCTDEVGWQLSAEALRETTSTADFHEGVTAFVEKRAPAWTGR